MSILEARDEQVERLTEKLSMSKEALQGHKERHSEKVSALETLVLQLRQKMAEGASGEGDAVWAKRLEDEHRKRENLQNELDKLAVMFERVEQEVQRQRKVNSAQPENQLAQFAEDRARSAEDAATKLKDENLLLRNQISALESKLTKQTHEASPAQEPAPELHLRAIDDLREQVSQLTDACQAANSKLLLASRDCRLKDDIIAGLRAEGGERSVQKKQSGTGNHSPTDSEQHQQGFG